MAAGFAAVVGAPASAITARLRAITDTAQDQAAIRDLAGRMAAAELAGDAAFFKNVLAPDVVIMPSGIPAIEGRDGCLEFDRGTFAQTLVRKETGETLLPRAATRESRWTLLHDFHDEVRDLLAGRENHLVRYFRGDVQDISGG